MKRSIPKISLLAALALLAACRSDALPNDSPRRIILLTLDTLRADRLGCYGRAEGNSPHIDTFAEQAVLYRDASCQAPWTQASFASLFTGRAPSEVWDGALRRDPPDTILAESLRRAGLHTVAVVANPNLRSELGFRHGFEHYHELFRPGEPRGRLGASKVSGDAVTDRVLELAPKLVDRDFFLWVVYMDTHAPFRRLPDAYYPEGFPLPEDYGRTMVLTGDLNHYRLALEREALNRHQGPRKPSRRDAGPADRGDPGAPEPPAEFVRALDQLYDAEVRFLDEQVGRLLDGLERLGLLDEALCILTADHGESLYDHRGYHGHGKYPFQATVHVPLILRWPGAGAGVVDEPVALVDLYPTILQHARTENPSDLLGARLSPEGRVLKPPILVHTVGWRYRAYREGPFKLVAWGEEPDAPWSLFHIGQDPGEKSDLASATGDTAPPIRGHIEEAFRSVEIWSRQEPTFPPPPEIAEQLESLGYLE